MSTPEQSEEMDMSEIAKDKDSDSEVEHSDEINISVSKDDKPPESEVKQSEEVNLSEIATIIYHLLYITVLYCKTN